MFTREAGATAFTRKRKPPVHGSPVTLVLTGLFVIILAVVQAVKPNAQAALPQPFIRLTVKFLALLRSRNAMLGLNPALVLSASLFHANRSPFVPPVSDRPDGKAGSPRHSQSAAPLCPQRHTESGGD